MAASGLSPYGEALEHSTQYSSPLRVAKKHHFNMLRKPLVMFNIYFMLSIAATIQNASQTIGNKDIWYKNNLGKVLKGDSILNTCIYMNYRVHRYKGPLLHLPSSLFSS